MNLYNRARKHFDMNRIKELTQDKELKVEKEFNYKVPVTTLSNWRNELDT